MPGASARDLQWVFNAYALTFGGLLLLAGSRSITAWRPSVHSLPG